VPKKIDPKVMERAVAAFRSGMSVQAAAEFAGVGDTTLARHLDELGIERRRQVNRLAADVDEDTTDQVVADYQSGRPVDEILETFRIGITTLYTLLDKRDVPRRRNRFAAKTELSEADKHNLVNAYRDVPSAEKLAQMFHVSSRKVRAVLDEQGVPRRRRRS